MKLETLKQMMREVIDQVREHTDVDELTDQEIGKLIDYAMYEILNPPKKSAKDRILSRDFGRWQSKVVDPKDVPFKSQFKNSHTVAITDDRPCDTEAPDNVVRVNFK
jgi:4-alpha-glucanotransferase|tara:strand:- start:1761 stop:2081 length:321 start_codon:yes stop_codon:yes gene_type:complete